MGVAVPEQKQSDKNVKREKKLISTDIFRKNTQHVA